MRIKRFTESEQATEISHERCDEIIENLTNIMVETKQDKENINLYINELDQYRDISKDTNDQIDDAVANLQLIRNDLDNIIDKYDSVVNNMNDYKDSGRDMLY